MRRRAVVQMRALLATSCLVLAQPVAAEPIDDATCPVFKDASRGLPDAGLWSSVPALGDVDGDGRLDLAAHPSRQARPGIWLNHVDDQGAIEWRAPTTDASSMGLTCGGGTAFADVDGDGHLDLGVADRCGGVRLYRGDGKGGFVHEPDPVFEEPRRGAIAIDFGDVDGDGHLDIATVAKVRYGFRLFKGDGEGRFAPLAMGLPDAGDGSAIRLADIDGDGRIDVATAFARDASALRDRSIHRRQEPVWLNKADGFRANARFLPDGGAYRDVAVGDLNGDGLLDLAVSGDEEWGDFAPLSVYVADGYGRWKPGPLAHPTRRGDPDTYEGVQLADLNGDGHLDLIALQKEQPAVRVWLGNGAAEWTACEGRFAPIGLEGVEGVEGVRLAVGDLDGDGRPDVAATFASDRTGGVRVFVQDGKTKTK